MCGMGSRRVIAMAGVLVVLLGAAGLYACIQRDLQAEGGSGLWPIDSLYRVQTVGVGLVEVPWDIDHTEKTSRLAKDAQGLAAITRSIENKLREQRIRVVTLAESVRTDVDGVVYLVVNYRKVNTLQYVYSVRLQFVQRHPRAVSGGATYEIEQLGQTVEAGLRPMATKAMYELVADFARDYWRINRDSRPGAGRQ